eukprot:1790162-Pleurochrysis_carterae.AAC.3
MWAVVLVIVLVQWMVCIRGIIQQWKVASGRKRRNEISRHWHHSPLSFHWVYTTTTIPSVVFMALAKLASGPLTENVGVTPLTSVCYLVFYVSFGASIAIHTRHAMKKILMRERLVESLSSKTSLLQVTQGCQYALRFLHISAAFIPIISSSRQDADFQRVCCFLFNGMVGMGHTFLMLGSMLTAIQMHSAISEMLTARASLARQTSSEELRASLAQLWRLRRRLTRLHATIGCQALLYAMLHFAVIAVPFLRDKISYVLATLFILMLLLAGTPTIFMYTSLKRTDIGHSIPQPQVEVEAPAEATAALPGTAASIRPTQSPDTASFNSNAHATSPTMVGTVRQLDC